MLKYIIKRILNLFPVMLGMSFIIFSIMALTPGDPALLILGESTTPEALHALREEMRLNDPFYVQYFRYIFNALQGDFGTSYSSRTPVLTEIFIRFPVTLTLAIASLIFSVVIGIPLGILSAVKQYSIVDNISLGAALLLASIPGFWLGLMLILFFSLRLGWFPAIGLTSIRHVVLPTITMSALGLATMIRMTRSSMLEVIRQDFIRTARAKGATERRVIWRHALQNAFLPIITVAGLTFGMQLGGAVITESVFAIPGVGTLMINAVRSNDNPMVMASVLFIAFFVCAVNLLVDILYVFIDPRIRTQYDKKR